MNRNVLICLLALGLLTACGTDNTTADNVYIPPSLTEQSDIVSGDTAIDTTDTTDTTDAADTTAGGQLPIHNVEVSVNTAATDDPNVIEISEEVFIAQINDIYYNFECYADKTIVVEGMYSVFYAWDEQLSCPGVYRNGPGCCGNDGWGGFMLNYDGDLPQDNDWIRVTGTPELVTAYDGYVDLFLNVTSLEVLDVRGAEFVLQ